MSWLLIIVLVVVVLLVIYLIGAYNGLIRRRNQIENAWSQIDVQLKRRIDLIPNLVETVKGYAAHERETLERSTPSTSTWPLVAASRLPAIVRSVLLPEPLGPMIATSSPRSTERSISRSACTSAAPAP